MLALGMDFFYTGFPIGQWWGITVRVHFTLLIYGIFRITGQPNVAYEVAYLVGLFVCILLHEFGHALAARWCDGDCDEILLWPLGGLAYCRPAFHPTAHLITTVAGPLVTLVLAALFCGIWFLIVVATPGSPAPSGYGFQYLQDMAILNVSLLAFNLIPAFPMDGGRILRDTIWHWMSAEKATKIAVVVSQIIAICGAAVAIVFQQYWLLIFPGFILLQCFHEKQIVAAEARGTYQFSIRERIKRGSRKRAFHKAVKERAIEDAARPFHQCAACGRTGSDSEELEFRVCTDCSNGEEYCPEHLHNHAHK